MTGIMLAVARVAGETAPLLFTAFGNQFWHHGLSGPISSLAGADLHLRHLPVRRLAPTGLGGRAGAPDLDRPHQPGGTPADARAIQDRTVMPGETKLEVRQLDAWFGASQALQGHRPGDPERAVTAIIGPSGCGKSTLIRCLNRMHEVVPGARVAGEVLLDGAEHLRAPASIRCRSRPSVGMVFQRPNPFPTMSIFDNVVAGLRLNGERRSRADLDAARRAQPAAGGALGRGQGLRSTPPA